MEIDEALINLWDAGFEHINGPGERLGRGEANRARSALGLATRRELGSAEYWAAQFELDVETLPLFLDELGVQLPFRDGRLTKRAIRRLRAEARAKGIAAPVAESGDQGSQEPTVEPPLEWVEVGHRWACRCLSAAEVMFIHEELVTDFAISADPISPAGVRSEALLESAVARPQTSLDGTPKYPTVEMAAAALLHAVVHNHPFYNGNKRTALVAMLVFLDENGLSLTCEEDELFKLLLQLAQHALVTARRHELPDSEVLHLARWIKERSRWTQKGERPISWRRLRRILADFNCVLDTPAVGNRLNISRTVPGKASRFRRPKPRELRTQTAYTDDGRDVEKGSLNKIRHDLELDDEHGVDSKAFYENDSLSPSDFVIRYRKTLRRLARV